MLGQKLKPMAGFFGVEQLATGQDLLCARTKLGQVVCQGWLGFARDWHSSEEPVEIPGLRGATDIDANHFHVCGVVNGEVRCFGDNEYGQLGQPLSEGSKEPLTVPLPKPAIEVGVGQDHTCARLDDGTVWCWGSDQRGQLGRGRVQRSNAPTPVFGTGRILLEP